MRRAAVETVKMKYNETPDIEIPLFQDKLLSWFKNNGRHYFAWRQKNLTAYEIVIAEILLQRTKAETVEKFYPLS